MIETISNFLGGKPGMWTGKTRDDIRRKIVWTGLVSEFYPDLGRHDLSDYGLANSASDFFYWKKSWKTLPVTIRHAWIEFFMQSDHKRTLMSYLTSDPVFLENSENVRHGRRVN